MVAYYTMNGSHDPRTMYLTPRKLEGWHKEMAVHLPALIRQQPKDAIWHLPFGTRDPAKMEFDARVWLRLNENTARTRASHSLEMTNAFGLAAACCTNTRFWFYLGSPEHSEIMATAWAKGNYVGLANRVASSIQTFIEMQSLFDVKVGIFLDAVSCRDKDSLSAWVFRELTERYGITVGIETRPMRVADWANRADVPCITIRKSWHDFESNPDYIPSAKLLGPQYVICDKRDEAEEELKAGRIPAFIGEWK